MTNSTTFKEAVLEKEYVEKIYSVPETETYFTIRYDQLAHSYVLDIDFNDGHLKMFGGHYDSEEQAKAEALEMISDWWNLSLQPA